MTSNNKHPRSIQLTPDEQEALRGLAAREQSSMQLWLRAYRARGIEFRQRLPVAFPEATPGAYRLEWHSRPLGPEAIRQAVKYRDFQVRKEQEFTTKLQKRGQERWQ